MTTCSANDAGRGAVDQVPTVDDLGLAAALSVGVAETFVSRGF